MISNHVTTSSWPTAKNQAMATRNTGIWEALSAAILHIVTNLDTISYFWFWN